MESKTGQEAQIEIVKLQANGMIFRCRVCGLENSGEPVILLHGFPETSQIKGEYSLLELDAGHTLVQEQFERVNHEILNHIQRYFIKD